MKAYLASTSDDLSEIRLRVSDALNDWGLEPINYEDNFYVEPGLNTHDVCLKNVEALNPTTDCLITIIDRTFGGLYNGSKFHRFRNYSKDQFSYGHISITWAETALAYELGITVIPFIYHESVVDHDEYRKAKRTGHVDFQPKYLNQTEFTDLKKFQI
ncbi:MAG: DUF4062 domain-containing protein [Nitrospirae bacterium]|nr:DUF4062 domain-containing protein [Nitrospirota bacterium]